MKTFLDPRFALALVLAFPAAALAEAPLRGDAVRGEQLFRMECASCHGADARGDAGWRKLASEKGLGQLPDLRDAAFLVQRSDAQLRAAIRNGEGKNGPLRGHAFGAHLTSLETWDLVQWLRNGVFTVTHLFPQAAKFTAKDFTIDGAGLSRLKDGTGLTLADAERQVVILTVYGGARAEDGAVKLVPWKPVNLDLLEAKDRIGFLCFDELLLPGETAKLSVGLAIGRDGKLKQILVQHPDAARRAEHEKALAAFVGQGERKPVKLKAPRNVKGADKYEVVLTRAFARATEGIAQYDKSERERTAFD